MNVMKSLVLGVAMGLAAGGAWAQGTVQFANSALSKIKLASDPSTLLVDCPVGYRIGLFWGTSADNLTLSTPTAAISSPGIFSGGIVYPIAGTQEGQRVYLKLAGWGPSTGDDWRTATYYGESQVVQVTLGPTAGPGTVIFQSVTGTSLERVKPFVIGFVPEPSSLALAGTMGVLALLRWGISGRRRLL